MSVDGSVPSKKKSVGSFRITPRPSKDPPPMGGKQQMLARFEVHSHLYDIHGWCSRWGHACQYLPWECPGDVYRRPS